MAECADKGFMVVIVGQEGYDDSPFTQAITEMVTEDITVYYRLIFIIFVIVKLFLFCILSSWLRIKVTSRLEELTNTLEHNEESLADRNQSMSDLHHSGIRKQKLIKRDSVFVGANGRPSIR